MVAAGSVVLCGSVLLDADACGVAFRVALWLAPLLPAPWADAAPDLVPAGWL